MTVHRKTIADDVGHGALPDTQLCASGRSSPLHHQRARRLPRISRVRERRNLIAHHEFRFAFSGLSPAFRFLVTP